MGVADDTAQFTENPLDKEESKIIKEKRGIDLIKKKLTCHLQFKIFLQQIDDLLAIGVAIAEILVWANPKRKHLQKFRTCRKMKARLLKYRYQK